MYKEVFYMSDNKYETNYSMISIENTLDGKKYKISLELPMNFGWYDGVSMVIEKFGPVADIPLKYSRSEGNMAIFEATVDLKTSAIYRYYFKCTVNNQLKYIKNGTTIVNNISEEDKLKMSVNFEIPDWAKGAIMYHIFVDRYRKGRKEELPKMPRRTIHKSWNEEMVIGPDRDGIWNADFYGGDLKGIEESLDYIKSLGVSILYLSPIVWSQSNHRYDAADYMEIDPYAGCNEDLKSLCDAAHRKGMRVVLDAVFNHTGNDSKYFNEYGTFSDIGAFQSTNSKYSNFYRKYYENGQVKYDYWWGMPNLPVCNGNSYEWKNFITGVNGVIDHWFHLGIDGLRLDVADELTDEFIELIRIAVKRNKEDGFILGEVWKNPMRMDRGYIDSGKGMDSVMNYPLMDALIRYFKYGDVNKLDYIIRDIKIEYPKDTINTLMNFTSTHDISRAINLFATYDFQEYGEWAWNPNNSDLEWCSKFKLTPGEYKYGRDVYESYVFALTFMPGILSIFYGDEIGLEGMGNLANRKQYLWGYRDKKLLEFFRYMGNIRRNEEFLKEADLNLLDVNRDYIMFERINNDDKLLVAVNRTDDEKKFALPGDYEQTEGRVYTLKKSLPGRLNPYGAIAIKNRK